MTLAAFTSYDISLFLHITAVVVGFGATFAEALMFPVAMKLDSRHLPYVHRLQLAINQRLASPALAVIVLTGVYQTIDGNWDFGAFWINATFVIVIALGGLLGAYFVPTDRRLEAMAARELEAAGGGPGVTMSEEYQRQARREGMLGAVAGLLVIAAIFLMVVKPVP
jgi:uncharacterized membrane protein